MIKKNLILIVLVFTGLNAFSQGLNNEQFQFDNSDSENILELFYNIETFKFYLNSKLKGEYDIIFETYRDKKMINTKAVIADMISKYGMNPLSIKMGDDFLRLYVQNNLKEDNNVRVGFKYLNISSPQTFDNLDLKFVQSRAFYNIPDEINSKTALLAIYGNEAGNFISCPGDATPELIINLYDWVCFVYVEKFNQD